MLYKYALRTQGIAVVFFLLSVLIVSVAFFGTTRTAHAAASSAPSNPMVATLTVGMNIDCSSVPNTAQAQSILQQKHLCKYAVSGRSSPSPDIVRGRVCGDCGCLILNLFNAKGGYLQWNGEITSTQGPIVNASYAGSWTNNNLGTVGPVARNSGLIFTSDWLDIATFYTRAGTIYGRIDTATDTLWWGATCTNADSVYNYANVT